MIPRYFDLPAAFESLATLHGSVLLESSRPDAIDHTSFLFSEPVSLLELERPEDAPQFFR